ncbi:MAG TPA: PAS domain-containing protein, partial [Burkholderiales bacterium]|nr:PAS domain-containing protein [Burkholderiales bacterium]
DISERKRTEQALREQRTLLAEAQKVAGLGCWEWDPASGRLTWSDELCRMYGVDAAASQPSFEAYLERVHPEDRQHAGAMVARALIDGRAFTAEERIVRPDGAVRWLRSHCEVVRDAAGRAVKLLGACLDVTESRAAEEALRAAAASLQALSRRLVEAEEAERRRIAGELHDRVGQNLSALNINLDIVLGALGEAAPMDVRVRLRDSLALVDGTLQSIENVMAELRPPLLEEYGLGAALGWYAEEFFKRTGIDIEFDDQAREKNRALRRDAAVALFRIAQEALNNVAKHAGAKRVAITVRADDARMSVEIRDDGAGFDAAAAEARASRRGMTTMRERAEAAGGRLEIASSPGSGTVLRASVPF